MIYQCTPAGRRALRHRDGKLSSAARALLASLRQASMLEEITSGAESRRKLLQRLQWLEKKGLVESVSREWIDALFELADYAPLPAR